MIFHQSESSERRSCPRIFQVDLPTPAHCNYTICFRNRPQQAVPTYPQAKVPVVRAMI